MRKVRSIFKDAVYDISTQEVVPLGSLRPVAKFDFISYLDELINYHVEKSSECKLIINDDYFIVKILHSHTSEEECNIMFMNIIHQRYIDVAKYLLSESFTLKVIDNRKRTQNMKE